MLTKCFLDIDDVLGNCSRAVLVEQNVDESSITWGTRNLHEQMGKSHEEVWGSLGINFWADMPKTAWADDLVSLCKETFGEHNVFLLTAPIYNQSCYAGKFIWVERNYPELLDSLFIGRRKQNVVDEHSLLIDDSYHNQEHFEKNGKLNNFYMFPALTNKFYEKALIYEANKEIAVKETASFLRSFIEQKSQSIQEY